MTGFIAVFLFSLMFIAETAATAPADFPTVSRQSETCFTGDWENEDTFLAMAERNNPHLKDDEAGRRRAQDYYRDMRETFECRWFDYPVDGFDVRGFYIIPRKFEDEQLPVVVFNRGGNADTGVVRSQYLFGKLFPVAKEGYIIVGSMYRGARRGDKPHPDRLADEFGGKEVNDILALMPIIDSIPKADAENIAIWGSSRGGMMAYLAARKEPRFETIIAEATPTDLVAELKVRPEMAKVHREWIPGYEQNPEAVLRERSAIHWVDELPQDTDVLILHAVDDKRVTPNSALNMAVKMQELGRPYRLVMFEKGGHGVRHPDAPAEIVSWLDMHLTHKVGRKMH